MATARLLAGGAFALASAALLAAVGLAVRRQRAPGAAGIARGRFALWWLALAFYTALDGALDVAVATGPVPTLAIDAWVAAFAVLIVVMFWGLMSYMAFLVTGRVGALRVITWVYAAQLVLLIVVAMALEPVGAHASGWGVDLEYAHADFAAANIVFALAFLLPPLLAAIAYLGLWLRVRDAPARRRIAIVGGSIAAWLIVALAGAAAAKDADTLQVGLKTLGVVTAVGPLLAYRPPRFLATRLPQREHEVARDVLTPEQQSQARAELHKRVHELV